MIENGANIEAKDINSSTPLLYAVQSNRLDMVKFLVDKGANINARNNLSQAPLEPGGTFINQEIISFLREKEMKIYTLLAADLSNQPEVVVNGVSQDALEDLLQNNEIVYAKGKAASGASKSFLWINGLFSWAKGKGSLLMSGVVNSLWPASVTEETSSDFATQDNLNLIDYSRVDMNGTILLLDTFIRKITGQKYVSTADQPISLLEAQDYALNITEGFEKLVKQAGKDSKISIHRLDIDFMGMHKEITGKIMGGKFDEISGILNSYVEKACPGREAGCPGKLSLKKFDKFITEFNKRLDVVLNQPMQQILSRDSTLKASNVKEQQISLEPRSYLNGTSVQGHLTQDRGLRNQGRDLIP
ncbi:tRNA nuclease WapA [Trichonephila inaurata madagascariensis]|uniref:tRNA nuclease WapA n=1 Tax=Trichonephila inaurata madagascariensis TaxID=2747483 RepID=A0A8X6Y474_9ARAC|nr:tRNA nuclease WapA [Trichonephila inaurata madagascariensis]